MMDESGTLPPKNDVNEQSCADLPVVVMDEEWATEETKGDEKVNDTVPPSKETNDK